MERAITEMDRVEQAALIMDFAVSLGEHVLIRGGELWRVDAVLNDVLQAYGLHDIGIFMLPHTLIISAKMGSQEPIIRQKNVGSIVVDMEELSRLNSMVREIKVRKPAPEDLIPLLEQAIHGKSYPAPVVVMGMACALLSLNYLIGGGWKEAVLVAFGIIVVMGADMYLSAIPGTNKMAVCAFGSFLIGMVDMAALRMGYISDPYLVMVVTAIGLVPGIPLINSCREMLCGRVLCGGLLFMQAFMETLAVVCGFAVAINLLGG